RGQVDALRRRLDALDVALAELVDAQGADVDAPGVGEVAHRVDHGAGFDQPAGFPVHQVLAAGRIDVDHGGVVGAHQGSAVALKAGTHVVGLAGAHAAFPKIFTGSQLLSHSP